MGIHELPPQESNRFRRSWNEFQEVLSPIEKDTKAPKQIRDRILGLRTALGKLRSSDDTRAFVQILGQAHELASEFISAPAPTEETFQELPEIEIAAGEARSVEESSLYEKPWTVSLDAAHYSASANLTPAESRNRLKALIARMKPEIAQEPKEETDSERAARLAASQGVSPRLASREFERVQKTEKESQPVEPSPIEHAEAIEKDERSEPPIIDPSFSAVKDRIDPKFSEAAPLERRVDLGPLPETFPDTKVDWNAEESDEAAQVRAGFHKGPERRAALFDESRKADLGPLPERYPDTKVHWEEGESEEAATMRAALHKGPVAETGATPEAPRAAMDFGDLGSALEAGALRARKEAWAVKLAKGARLGKARNEMLSAERIRLDAEYDFYAKRSLVGRWIRRRVGGEETRAIAETDAAYAAKAFAFEQKLEKRLEAHLIKRQEGMSREEAEKFEKKFSARYRRMVISRDVIDHGEERLTAMRDRAFGEKEKTVVEKGLALYLRQNAALEQKLGKEAARAVRILGFSVAGATLAAPFGAAFGVSAIGLRFARSLAGTVLGGAIGAGAGEKYEERFGTAARRSLEGARENVASTEEAFAAKRRAYRKGNERAIERKRRITEALSAALVGAGVSLEAAHMLAGHEALQKAAEHAVGSSKVLEHHPLGSGAGHSLESKITSSAPVSPTAQPAFESPVVHAEHGLGYEHMLKELRADLMKQGHSAADFPKGSDAYALLSADDSHLNTELHRLASDPAHHFFDADSGESVAVHDGATLSVDKGGVAHFSADGTSPGVVAAPEHAATTPAHHAAPDERAVTAKLNEDELLKVQEGNAANVAWHAAHPDVSSAAPAAPSPEAAATHAPTPLHSANAADASHEAPSAGKPAVSEAMNRATEHALEKGLPFENHNGVVVDPAHVGAYRYEYNGRPILFVSGGGLSEDNFQGRLDYIQDTLAKDPSLHGAHIFVDATQLRPDGSTEPAVGEILITDEGNVTLIRGTVENVFTGKKMSLPDPESFTNRYLPPPGAARTS